MSVPISAITDSAVRRCTPGIVQSSSTAPAKGESCSSISSESSWICSSRKSRWARIAEHLRIGGALHERVEHCSPGCAEDVGGDAVELDAGVLEDLVQPVSLALTLADLRLAVAGHVAQRPDRLRRHETAPQKPRLEQLAEPGGVGDVGFAARHLLDVAGVDEQTVELVLEDRPDRLPVDARRFP